MGRAAIGKHGFVKEFLFAWVLHSFLRFTHVSAALVPTLSGHDPSAYLGCTRSFAHSSLRESNIFSKDYTFLVAAPSKFTTLPSLTLSGVFRGPTVPQVSKLIPWAFLPIYGHRIPSSESVDQVLFEIT